MMRTMPTHHRQRGMSLIMTLALMLALVLVAVGSTLGTLFLTGVIGDAAAFAATPEQDVAKAEKPAIYLPIEPALITNFDKHGRVGYLQIRMDVMARDQAVIDAVRKHMAVVRNDLLLLMSSKSYEELADRAGKEALRQQALEAINEILAERHVDGRVEAVYFTAFVMQ